MPGCSAIFTKPVPHFGFFALLMLCRFYNEDDHKRKEKIKMLPAIILFALTYVLFILTGMLPGSQIIGASANIAGIGILRKEGYEAANSDFFKIGIPFTMAAIIPAHTLHSVLLGM